MEIAQAVQRVLNDEKYARNAKVLAQTIKEDAQRNNIVEELEMLAEKSAHRQRNAS